MRILVVHSFYKPGLPSGENDVVLNQVDLLRERGFDVELWGPTSPDDVGSMGKLRIGFRVALGRGQDPTSVVDRLKPDLIHVHNLFPNISTDWIARTSAPVVMSLHNYRTVCANGLLLRNGRPCADCLSGSSWPAVQHACYRDSRAATVPVLGFQRHLRAAIERDIDLLAFTSEMSREVLAPLIPHRADVVLPDFVSDVGFRETAEMSDPYFVVLGRLSPEKGVDALLRDWPADRRLVIIGEGPQRPELERLAARMRVEFRGFVDARERDVLLQGATGLVLPSVTLEADPVVVAQALSAGTPCVVDHRTAPSRLADISAAIHPFHDVQSLEDALNSCAALGKRTAARKLYESHWSAQAWLERYMTKVIGTIVPKIS